MSRRSYRNPYRPIDLGAAPVVHHRRPDMRTLLRVHLRERVELLRDRLEQPVGNSWDASRWEDASQRLQELGLLCTALGLDLDRL